MDIILDFNYFSFSNCNINPDPTHLLKHQILSPNHQFSERIWYVECCSVHAHMAWSQKFRMTPVIQPPTRLQNVRFCLFLLTSVVQNVCVCTMDFVSAGKIHYYYMWPFAKKLCHGWISTMTSSNEISCKLPPPEMKSWLRPWSARCQGRNEVSGIVGNFQRPPQSFGAPIMISVPGELLPFAPACYDPEWYSSICNIKISGSVYCRKNATAFTIMQHVKSYGNICMLASTLPLSDKNVLSVFHDRTLGPINAIVQHLRPTQKTQGGNELLRISTTLLNKTYSTQQSALTLKYWQNTSY